MITVMPGTMTWARPVKPITMGRPMTFAVTWT